jgi:hypothetical protein
MRDPARIVDLAGQANFHAARSRAQGRGGAF